MPQVHLLNSRSPTPTRWKKKAPTSNVRLVSFPFRTLQSFRGFLSATRYARLFIILHIFSEEQVFIAEKLFLTNFHNWLGNLLRFSYLLGLQRWLNERNFAKHRFPCCSYVVLPLSLRFHTIPLLCSSKHSKVEPRGNINWPKNLNILFTFWNLKNLCNMHVDNVSLMFSLMPRSTKQSWQSDRIAFSFGEKGFDFDTSSPAGK